MNVLLFYFSGTGNTRWAAERLCGMLAERGHRAQAVAVETADMAAAARTAAAFDRIGFACPLYGADIPRIMRRSIRQFLDAATAVPGIPRKLFFISTFAYVNGSGVFEARRLLRHTPFQVESYVNIKMINSAPEKGARKSSADADAERRRSATRKLAEFVGRLESGRPCINGAGPQLLIGMLIRALLRNTIANNYRRMRVDLQACTRCLQCVRNCPVQCIQFAGEHFTFSESCEACMRCYHGCPVHAISNG